MEPNFGILYNRPRVRRPLPHLPSRAGPPADSSSLPRRPYPHLAQPKLTSPNSLAPASSSAIATAISSATSAGGALGSPAFDDGSGFDLPEAEAAEKRAEKKRRQSVSHTEKDVVTVGACPSPPFPLPARDASSCRERGGAAAPTDRLTDRLGPLRSRVTDQIRPDWQAKLDAVKATVARRANRRIVMRQVRRRLSSPAGVEPARSPR